MTTGICSKVQNCKKIQRSWAVTVDTVQQTTSWGLARSTPGLDFEGWWLQGRRSICCSYLSPKQSLNFRLEGKCWNPFNRGWAASDRTFILYREELRQQTLFTLEYLTSGPHYSVVYIWCIPIHPHSQSFSGSKVKDPDYQFKIQAKIINSLF